MSNTVDMLKGIGRRIWACALRGRRINSVTIAAECLFWRLHLVADDCGNLPADPQWIKSNALPKRDEFTIAQVRKCLEELVTSATDETPALITSYEVRGEMYFNISGFEYFQPPGRNGKRVQKYPRVCPGASKVDPGASKVHPGDPGSSSTCSGAGAEAEAVAEAVAEAEAVAVKTSLPTGATAKEAAASAEPTSAPSLSTAQGPPDPPDRAPGLAEALAALDRWSLRDRQVSLSPVKNETQQATRWLIDVLAAEPPVIHAGEPVSAVLPVPRAIDALMGKGTVPFKSVKFVQACIRAEIDDWRNRGIQASNGTQHHTGGAGRTLGGPGASSPIARFAADQAERDRMLYPAPVRPLPT